MTPLERAEKALRDSLGLDWPYSANDGLKDAVVAVLTAIREPSEGMIKAGECDGDMPFAEESWELMIDAALAEGV